MVVAERNGRNLDRPLFSSLRMTFPRLRTADLLRQAGYSVVETGSAAEATTVLSSGTLIDVVFSDVSLPGAMGGLSLVLWIYDRYPTIPVVLTSAALRAVILTLKELVAVTCVR